MKRWLGDYGGLVLLLAAFVAVALHFKNDLVGILFDDGVYLLGAKALAQGHGYRLMADPHQPGIVQYPPLFSVLLAPLCWLAPSPITLIAWAKTVNIVIAALALGGCYWLARQIYALPKLLSAVLVGVVAANFYWLYYATHLMSEPLYLLLSTLTLGLAHRLTQGQQSSPTAQQLFGLVLLSAALFYTRTLGIVLILSLSLWLGLRFSWRTALRYATLALLCCLPWTVWVYSQPPSMYSIEGYWVVPYNQSYLTHLWLALSGTDKPFTLFGQGILSLFTAFSDLLIPLSPPSQKSGVPHPWALLGPVASLGLGLGMVTLVGINLWNYGQALRPGPKGPLSEGEVPHLGISPIALYTGLYLATLPCWFATNQLPRFLLMVLPFVLMMGVSTGLRLGRSYPDPMAAMAAENQTARQRLLTLFCLAALLLQGLGWPSLQSLSENNVLYNRSLAIWPAYQETIVYLNANISPKAVVWCWQSTVFPVYAKGRYINYNIMPRGQNSSNQDFTVDETFVHRVVIPVFEREKVDYLLSVPAFSKGQLMSPVDPHTALLQQLVPQNLQPVFQSANGLVTLYRWHPPTPKKQTS